MMSAQFKIIPKQSNNCLYATKISFVDCDAVDDRVDDNRDIDILHCDLSALT